MGPEGWLQQNLLQGKRAAIVKPADGANVALYSSADENSASGPGSCRSSVSICGNVTAPGAGPPRPCVHIRRRAQLRWLRQAGRPSGRLRGARPSIEEAGQTLWFDRLTMRLGLAHSIPATQDHILKLSTSNRYRIARVAEVQSADASLRPAYAHHNIHMRDRRALGRLRQVLDHDRG